MGNYGPRFSYHITSTELFIQWSKKGITLSEKQVSAMPFTVIDDVITIPH